MKLVDEISSFFFFNDTAPTEIYTLPLHDALPIFFTPPARPPNLLTPTRETQPDNEQPGCLHTNMDRSEEHTSELQSQSNLVCRLLLEKKKRTAGSSSRRPTST